LIQLVGTYLLFFLSGFSALIYEVAWMRVLGLILGNTNQAASCVLAAFLGGLALGAMLGGKLSDRLQKNHLAIYGFAELGIALVAPVVTGLLYFVGEYLTLNHNIMPDQGLMLTLARLTVSGILLLIPTILMGATLPILIRFLTDHWQRPAHFFSYLYSINTLGAVAGSLTACFVGFPYLGITGTILLAAAFNATVGISAVLINRSVKNESGSSPTTAEATTSDATVDADSVSIRLLSFLAFCVGFTSLSYEVLWNRLIKFHIAPDTYAFTLMVSTFLMGIALGSWLYDKVFYRANATPKQQLETLSLMQLAAALACGSSLLAMPLATLVRQFFEPGLHTAFGSGGGTLASHMAVTLVFMLLPATLLGVSFPIIGGLAAAKRKQVGGAVGKIYSANTIGCVVGSIAAGLLLIPNVGSYTAFQITVVLSVATGILALAKSSAPRNVAIGMAVAALIPTLLFIATRSPYEARLGTDATPKLVRFAEDPTSTIMVFEHPDHVQLVINGQPYANTILNGKRYMRLLGHLPVLLHNKPEEALNICFGTGTTSGSIISHPEVKHLDIVDLSKEVLNSAQYFEESNHGVAKRGNVTMHVNDGRNFLLTTSKKYDVVTFEPPPPLEAGVVNLYSQEFYQLVKQHLNPGGIVCQWVPMDQESGVLWKQMIQTAYQVFPYISVWETNDGQAVLIASEHPIKLSYKELDKRIKFDDTVHASLDEVGLGNATDLLSTYLFSQDKFPQLLSGIETITDDRPHLEFYLPYDSTMIFPSELEQYASKPQEILTDPIPDPGAFEKARQAMTLIRKADQIKRSNGPAAEAHQYAHKALQLAPDNPYFKFAATRTFQ
jgi:spermidine synthase